MGGLACTDDEMREMIHVAGGQSDDETVPFDVFSHVVHSALLEVGIDVRPRRVDKRSGPGHISPDGATTSGLRRRQSLIGMPLVGKSQEPEPAKPAEASGTPPLGRRNSISAL